VKVVCGYGKVTKIIEENKNRQGKKIHGSKGMFSGKKKGMCVYE